MRRSRSAAPPRVRAAVLSVGAEVLSVGADGYRARFELPKGSYPTVVLGELVKGAAEVPEEEG